MSYWNYRECYDDETVSGGTPDDEPDIDEAAESEDPCDGDKPTEPLDD